MSVDLRDVHITADGITPAKSAPRHLPASSRGDRRLIAAQKLELNRPGHQSRLPEEGAVCSSDDVPPWLGQAFTPDRRDLEPYAKALVGEFCDACPIREACLRDALNDPSAIGIRGGTTTLERHRMRLAGAA
jgi:hypothetical protein